VRFDLVAQDEIGAQIAGPGLAELVAEGGQCLGPPGRARRPRPGQPAVDLAGGFQQPGALQRRQRHSSADAKLQAETLLDTGPLLQG